MGYTSSWLCEGGPSARSPWGLEGTDWDMLPKQGGPTAVLGEGRNKGVRSESPSSSSSCPKSNGPASLWAGTAGSLPSSPSESESSGERMTRCLHTGQVFLVCVSQGSTHLQW